MGRLLIGLKVSALMLWATLLPPPAGAISGGYDASLDVAVVGSNGTRSFLDNGLGELRFDAHHEGLQLDNLRFGLHGEFADIVHLRLEAVSYADRASNPLDLTEAYLELRPFPLGPWRSRFKLGAFYAPISLENRLPGWRSAYLLSPSAINTWVGEELRTFGAEYDLDWLGRQRGHSWEFGLGGSLYGWNESAGQLIAERGWAIHDRQATIFGKFGQSIAGPILDQRLLTAEGDHRIGYYADTYAKYLDWVELRVLYYDNRADISHYSAADNNFPWLTKFDSVGIRLTPTARWSLISQWLSGRTCLDAEDEQYCWHFDSEFVLLSWALGPNRLSARYDRFDLHQSPPADGDDDLDHGHAWTIGYQRDLNRHLGLALEFLQIDSRLNVRTEFGLPESAREREIQLMVRARL